MAHPTKKQLWLAPIHSPARDELIALCQERFRAGREDSFIYLTAEVGLLQQVRERLLDGTRVKGCHDLCVFMFHELVAELLGETRSTDFRLSSAATTAQTKVRATPIDEATRVLLVAEAVDDLVSRDALSYFTAIAERPGLARSVARTIGEIKRAGKHAGDFRQFATLALKSRRDRDLVAIYERYQQLLDARGVCDQDDLYLRARDWLDERGLAGGPLGAATLLIVDGFYDFTPVQLQILDRLIRIVPEVIVHFIWDQRNTNVFEPIISTAHQVEAIAEFDRRVFSPSQRPSEAIERLTTRFLNRVADEPAGPSAISRHPEEAEVSFFAALDRRVEVREASRRIKRLLVKEGFAPSEIACIVRDGERYLDEFARTFGRQGVPFDLTRRFGFSAFNSVRAMARLLEFLREPDQMELLARAAVCGYFGPGDAASIDRFKNDVARIGEGLAVSQWRLRATRIIQSLRLQLQQQAGQSEDQDLDRLTRTSHGRKVESLEKTAEEVDALRDIGAKFHSRATPLQMCAALQELLGRLQFHERLQDRLRSEQHDPIRFASAARDHDAAKRAIESLNAACAAMDGAGARELTRVRFCDLMLEALELGEFTGRLGEEGGVRVLEVTRARGLKFRAVFLLGLVDGKFPKPAEADWVYSITEREQLAEQGLVLEDRSPRTMKKEELLFYHCAVQATERLCLSYPRTTEEETASVASYFFTESIEIFHGRSEEYVGAASSRAGERNPFVSISSLPELKAEVLRSLWAADGQRPQLALALYSRLHDTNAWSPLLFRRIAAEQMRAGREFSPFDGLLSDPGLQRQLAIRFGREHVFSATQLNLYGQCPFRFFIERVLEMESLERAELDLEALDRGRLLHKILYGFFHEHLGERLEESKREACRGQLHAIAKECFAEYERDKPPLSEKLWEIQQQSMLDDLLALLDFEIEAQKSGGRLLPHWLEQPFGMPDEHRPMSEEPPPPSVRLARDDDAVEIRGRIDRVDRSIDGKFVAYDYKSKSTREIESIKEGLDFQIPVYLMALQQHFLKGGEEIIGGGYYSIAQRVRDFGMFRAAFNDYLQIKKKKSLVEEDEWTALLKRSEQYIWEYASAMRRGDFRVAPRDCPSPCDYRAVCRFERHRIARKTESEE